MNLKGNEGFLKKESRSGVPQNIVGIRQYERNVEIFARVTVIQIHHKIHSWGAWVA